MDKIKLSITLPMIKMELVGNPEKHLTELRKLFSELRKITTTSVENDFIDEIQTGIPIWRLSKDVQKNEKVVGLLTQLAQVEEGTIIRKIVLDNIKELTKQGPINKFDIDQIKKKISKELTDIESENVSSVFIHTLGNLEKEETSMILDQVMKHFPHSKFETLNTKKNIEKTVIECVLFGQLPEEE